ncbi:ABC transporter ATP-binding protein [bacterium]|nr:ABC transporter ATP-binding protein [bacterium]
MDASALGKPRVSCLSCRGYKEFLAFSENFGVEERPQHGNQRSLGSLGSAAWDPLLGIRCLGSSDIRSAEKDSSCFFLILRRGSKNPAFSADLLSFVLVAFASAGSYRNNDSQADCRLDSVPDLNHSFPVRIDCFILTTSQANFETPYAISIRELRKRFGGSCALDGVSFSLRQGERLGFLGPNGAGKTTLVRCLSGRVRHDSGDIWMRGEPLTNQRAKSEIGVVPQELAIYEDLTARENMMIFGKFHGLRGWLLRDRVKWALHWTGLEDRSQHLVRNFSGGMKRRINLACGVLHSPRILLLDEPTVGVDPQSRERIYTMIDTLSDGGCSILLTTHHLEEAESQCDRLVILDRGSVVADGTIDELIDHSVGTSRWVRMRVESSDLEGTTLESQQLIAGHRCEVSELSAAEQSITTRMDDVAENLPGLLKVIKSQFGIVQDIEIQSPSLHHVFLELTGDHLRDD